MMDLIRPDWSGAPAAVGALSTVRGGGVSRVPYDDGAGGGGLNLGLHVEDCAADVLENRARLAALLPAEPAWLTQVHGTSVVDAALAEGVPVADASYTTRPGVVCAILTADCLPVLFCDTAGRVVGAAHAGWRGLAGGVLENTVAAMRAAGASELMAWLGPAIGPRQFEVGEEVRQAFAGLGQDALSAFQPVGTRPGKYLADIYALARIRLRAQGVLQVAGGGRCTVSEAGLFYSYRRDRVTGRMASLVWIEVGRPVPSPLAGGG
jgi:YfiH family protein